MYVPANPESAKLPDDIKRALGNLAGDAVARLPTAALIRELLSRGIIESTHGGLRFTESGRRIFREVRESSKEPSPESHPPVLPPDGQAT